MEAQAQLGGYVDPTAEEFVLLKPGEPPVRLGPDEAAALVTEIESDMTEQMAEQADVADLVASLELFAERHGVTT